jgi:flagellar M-ring protein FliF
MGATIRCFDNVRDAVVTINTGEDASYVLDSNKMVSASASVFVTMQEGTKLTNEQVEAIRRLVAHSVKGLEIGSVTVEDASGNTYNSTEAHVDSDASALKLQLEEDYENKIRTQVMQALVPFFGEGNVRVGVSCTVDINQTVLESTEYHLPEWADDGSTYGRGIVGSRVFNYIYERNGEETTGGVVGTSTNADLPEYVEDLPELNGNENLVDISGQTDYQTSSTNKQIIQTAGYLTDCSISVSINSKTADNLSTAEIIQHVARASGISGSYDEESGREYLEDKISVICAPFYDGSERILPAGPTLPVDMWVIYAAAAGLLLFLLVLLLILRRRKKKKKTKQAEQQNRDIEAFLAAAANARADQIQDGADVMSLQSENSIELRKDIRKFAEDNPEIAAQMLRGWLRGDDDNG